MDDDPDQLETRLQPNDKELIRSLIQRGFPQTLTPRKLALLNQAREIYLDEARKAELLEGRWYRRDVLIQTVASRNQIAEEEYRYICVLQPVDSDDDLGNDDPALAGFLVDVAHRVLNEMPEIKDAIYDYI